ncbi:UDP-glucose 4-epimerase [Spongiactinospora rosea]|uniref:UDP-glucose 4-epimerase n=1 Tax=Spongiactinospora rosea TaxID=2248750 RepID=A0A366LU47_9ACTN|nr:NAD-dependent epimerase/dehydratase family protein [Spongiactinospora rosea]RBQ16834.1 UDP-glucose 4-epimerase [Spongiactinospora rosea]
MRTLVTGGAGFIGSHLTDALHARGDTVTVVDSLVTGRATRLPDATDLRRIDITDAPAVAAAIREARPEVIYHLAAQIDVRTSVADPARDAAVNIGGTINLLNAARDIGARLVFTSTGGALYGAAAAIPSPEGTPAEPEAPYGTAKLCAEQYLALFNRLHGTRHAALRLGNVYGPRQDPSGEAGVVSIFSGAVYAGRRPTIYGDGKATRDYVYVADIVAALIAAGEADRAGVWNIGTGRETSVLDLVDLIATAAGHEVAPLHAPPRPGELQRSALDSTAARTDLGWEPKIAISDGIARVYSWVRADHPDRTSAGLGAADET